MAAGEIIRASLRTLAHVALIAFVIETFDKLMGWDGDPSFFVLVIAVSALYETKVIRNAR